MNRSIYQKSLDELKDNMESIPNTKMGMFAKVVNLATLHLRFEPVYIDRNLQIHPYLRVRTIIDSQIAMLNAFHTIRYAEDNAIEDTFTAQPMEEKHKDLFNMLWERYEGRYMEQYIERYKHRLKINDLRDIYHGKTCIDIGCGNGVFCFALADLGAEFAAGIDFGVKNIEHAERIAGLRWQEHKCEFTCATVYDLPYPDNYFDFAIQNGVFHHVDDEELAIKEAHRVLKPGGYFWYYTAGSGQLKKELFDTSVYLLRNVPKDFVVSTLISMGLSNNKVNHLSDGMSVDYRYTTWDRLNEQLRAHGFNEFKRLRGGFDTDSDDDVIAADSYGKEKFGEGDLRVLARKVV